MQRILVDVPLVAQLSAMPRVRGGDAALLQRLADALDVPVARIRSVEVTDNGRRGAQLSFVVADAPGDKAAGRQATTSCPALPLLVCSQP